MKNLRIVSLFVAFLCSQWSHGLALNLDDAQLAENTKNGWSIYVDTKSTVLMNLSYSGASTEAVVTITNLAIQAFAPAGTADNAHFGVQSGSISFVDYATIGSLCDAINVSSVNADAGRYKCELFGKYTSSSTALIWTPATFNRQPLQKMWPREQQMLWRH